MCLVTAAAMPLASLAFFLSFSGGWSAVTLGTKKASNMTLRWWFAEMTVAGRRGKPRQSTGKQPRVLQEREGWKERDIMTGGGAKVAVVSSPRELEVQVRYVLGIQAAAEKGLEQFPAPKEPVGLPPDAERATPRIEG